MKRCDAIQEELVAYRAGELDESMHREVQAHLVECAGCEQELEAFDRLERLLGEHWVAPAPSPTFASMFANRLAAEIDRASDAVAGKSIGGWLRPRWFVPVGMAVAALAAYLVVPFPSSGPDGTGEVARVGDEVAVEETGSGAPAAGSETSEGIRLVVTPERDIRKDLDLYVDYAIIEELEVLQAMEGEAPSSG